MKINIAIFVAPNSEDIETIVPIDLLRQAKLNIKVISLDKSKTLKLANGTQIICDSLINNEVLTKYNVFVFPGGSGILQVNNKKLSDFCYANANNKKYLFCANCVAPTKLFE
jgi:putative intracellular protease/amidase